MRLWARLGGEAALCRRVPARMPGRDAWMGFAALSFRRLLVAWGLPCSACVGLVANGQAWKLPHQPSAQQKPSCISKDLRQSST